jgi:molybdate transport system ATP-binding protein
MPTSLEKTVFRTKIVVPLDRFDLDVEYATHSRVTGVFGVSGSGKTTYIEAIAGLRKYARGYISCGDEVWLDSDCGICVPAHERRIGYVPQDHLLFPHMDVRGNLAFAHRRAERGGTDFGKVFHTVVDVLEIGGLLHRSVADLSGGERQRVALGRALCSGPRLLLLDEPTASLDAKLRLRILPFLKRVRDAFELPIVIVSHNPSELNALCDEVVAIRDGRVVASGRPMDVLVRHDLFGDADCQGFRNVLPAIVDSREKNVTVVRIGADGTGPKFVVPHSEAREGESVFVDVAASEILLSLSKTSGISARNVIPCMVSSIKELGKIVVVEAKIAESCPVVAVEITPDARDELKLHCGEAVYLIVKSSSFGVHASA